MSREAYRDIVTPAYVSTVEDFSLRYSDPTTRRKVSEERNMNFSGPPVKILLLGKPCSGKGTIAPMLSRAYRAVFVSIGNLLRAEVKGGSELGIIAEEQMKKGNLLPSNLLLSLIKNRLSHRDCQKNGWILDGFPRTPEQARLLSDAGLVPDCIIVLDRPDELVREFALGRMLDSATGIIYHPKFNPPPQEVAHRLVWRTDDTPEAINKRLKQYHATVSETLAEFRNVPTTVVDSTRSDIATFEKACAFIETVSKEKQEKLGYSALAILKEQMNTMQSDMDVDAFEKNSSKKFGGSLLSAVLRCNKHDIRNYMPVYIGEVQVGYAGPEIVKEIRNFGGSSAELREKYTSHDESAIVLAPYASSAEDRTRTLEGLVQLLVRAEIIMQSSVRNELQDIRPLTGLLSKAPPLARIERAAMIYLGIPSCGVHVNGFVRGPSRNGLPGVPHSVWIGIRSMSKATYPGLMDQMVAGGLSAGSSLYDNVARECIEEASVPIDFVHNIRPSGMVSYRYATRKGLSTKILFAFDLEVPNDYIPFNGDGEVEEFKLLTVEQVLESIRSSLHLWKPNSALVMIDFAVRHGFIDSDHPDYLAICHSLRVGWAPF